MLGSAPGTDRLNEWVADLDDDMSVDDLANHIAGTEAFQTEYPAFQTNREFAEAFLGNMLVGLSDELMMGAVGLVEGLLNDGLSRGSLALAVVDALYDISMQGEDHAAYADLGMSAMTFANKIEVASHHTLTARMADPSGDAIADVTADADSVTMAIDAIENPPAPPVEEPMGDRHVLTPVRDDYEGTDLGDVIIAEPVLTDANRFIATLNPFDSIDGGDGVDTLEVYSLGSDTPNQDSSSFVVSNAHVRNVENVVINAQGGVTADMDEWMGLMSVELERFNGNLDITVEGASVMLSQDADHDVSIAGAGGELSIVAGRESEVNIDSGENDHTMSVSVMGGSSVSVHSDGGLSESVTSVSLDGGLRAQDASISSDMLADFSVSNSSGSVTVNYAELTELTLMASAFGGKHGWGGGFPAARTAHLDLEDKNLLDKSVIDTLNVEVDKASAFRLESAVKTLNVSGTGSVHVDLNKFTDMEGAWLYPGDAKDGEGEAVSGQYVLVREDGSVTGVQQFVTLEGDEIKASEEMAASAEVFDLSTEGTDDAKGVTQFIAEYNDVQTKAGKDIENVGTTTTPAPDGVDDDLTDWLTTSLTSITVSDEAGLTINASGSKKLASVDASGSSGANKLTLKANDALTSVMGGSGNDTVTLKEGTLAETGLTVDLGDGDDTFVTGAEENVSPSAVRSSIHGGDGGNDTLAMADGADDDITYRDGLKTKSIYTGFETLDVGGGQGEYNFALLGVENLKVTKGTSDLVVLKNVTPGTDINVSGDSKKANTVAKIDYRIAAQDIGDFSFGSDSVDVNLTAAGAKTDKTDNPATSMDESMGNRKVTLALTLQSGVETLTIDSSANASGTATAGDYKNVVCADAAGTMRIRLTGDSQVVFKAVEDDNMADIATAIASVGYVDARSNAAGVEVHVESAGGSADTRESITNTLPNNAVTVLGSNDDDVIVGSAVANVQNVLRGFGGVDTITGGGADDYITGGFGGDMLSGGDGNTDGADRFDYSSASDSQIVFRGSEHSGYDRINNFVGGTGRADDGAIDGDVIRLSRSLLENANSSKKTSAVDSGGTAFAINNTEPEGDINNPDPTLDSIGSFLNARSNGLFETSDSSELEVEKHFVAVVQQIDNHDGDDNTTAAQNSTWVFIDVDGSGDFEAENDMVIHITGVDNAAVEATNIHIIGM